MKYDIVGKTIGLRKMKIDDCEKIVEWRNNERVRERYVYREKFSLEAQQKYYKEQVQTKNVFQYMICELNNNDRAIGSVVFKDYKLSDRQIEYGLFIGEDDTIGKGYGKETAQLSMELGFEKFEVDNIPSLVIHIKAGMLPCMILHDVECTDGERKDMIILEAKRKNT